MTHPRQLALNLPARPSLGRGDFFVSPSNALAVELLDAWQGWPEGKLALTGPPGSGKTHLAMVWAAETGAAVTAARALHDDDVPELARGSVVVEDADLLLSDATERALFHLHNLVLASGGRLLLTGQRPPARWPVRLPDLASRVRATALATLEPPDDDLLAAVLGKLFADRQIVPPADLAPWLVSRMERSFAAAQTLVVAIDRQALASRRRVSKGLAAQVLDNLARANQ